MARLGKVMRRYGNLFPGICSWENLENAARRCRKRKRYRLNTENFELRRESVLREIRAELLSHRWRPSGYRTFRIFDPKERVICAPPYRDRIVHHAVCNVIGPILERSMIDQSYSCRKGLGTSAARRQCRKFTSHCRYVLKVDVLKYFPLIDHDILKQKIRRRIKCRETLELIDVIIDSWHEADEEPRWFEGDDLLESTWRLKGLPIGSLTSQLFANVFLSKVDHMVQEEIRPRGYVRYTDDMLLFSDSKGFLHDALMRLRNEMRIDRLKIHPKKCRVLRTREGVPFLGFRFFPERVKLLRENRIRFERRMRKLKWRRQQGDVDLADIWGSMFGWFQFVREFPANEGLVIAECRRHSF